MSITGSVLVSGEARESLVKQALQKTGIMTMILEFPINENELTILTHYMKENKCLTTLKIPQGNFSQAALLEFAAALRDTNLRLQRIELSLQCVMPKLLVDVLQRNRNHYLLSVTIEILDKFSLLNNQNKQEIVALFLRCQREIKSANEICLSLRNESYPNSDTAALMCEKFAVAFSYFCAGIGRNAQHLKDHQAEIINTLLLFNVFITYNMNPEMRLRYYQNIYDECFGCFNHLINIERYNNQDESLAKKMRETIKKVLLSISTDNAEFYNRINTLLFLLEKHSLLNLLAGKNDPESIRITRAIHSCDISSLLMHLDKYIRQVELPVPIIREIYQSIFVENLYLAQNELTKLQARLRTIPMSALMQTPTPSAIISKPDTLYTATAASLPIIDPAKSLPIPPVSTASATATELPVTVAPMRLATSAESEAIINSAMHPPSFPLPTSSHPYSESNTQVQGFVPKLLSPELNAGLRLLDRPAPSAPPLEEEMPNLLAPIATTASQHGDKGIVGLIMRMPSGLLKSPIITPELPGTSTSLFTPAAESLTPAALLMTTAQASELSSKENVQNANAISEQQSRASTQSEVLIFPSMPASDLLAEVSVVERHGEAVIPRGNFSNAQKAPESRRMLRS